jgi:hypothetical protein
MLGDKRLSEFARLLFGWLVYEVDPRCGCLDDVTLVELAEHFGKKRDTVRAAFQELRDAGHVTFSFPGARQPGWVRVTGFYGEVLHPTTLLRQQWAQGRPWRERKDRPHAQRQEDER